MANIIPLKKAWTENMSQFHTIPGEYLKQLKGVAHSNDIDFLNVNCLHIYTQLS